ncbi:MAG: GntR family transcriptional regulator [Actinomycetaceae bacterium]|nr:GntR family transcriptional regulator [Arcanobacterium sp.]MDD7687516.1 GntR family transcriptional regulator [Actinomycetaceae bacterium]MDY5272991.1 GntR family transcriptional regulator [Arcanobacterium sp.]
MLSDKSFQAYMEKYPADFFPGEAKRLAPQNRSTATMDAIKLYILSNHLSPGDALPSESELCKLLRVSRSSVREALRKLEALDIVVVQRGRGSFVGNMSLHPLVDTLVIRNALEDPDTAHGQKVFGEVVATRYAIDCGVAPDLVKALHGAHHEKLHAIVEKMIQRSMRGEQYLEEDIAFHLGVFECLGNDLLRQLTGAMWLVHQTIIPSLSEPSSPEIRETAIAHQHMLDAAERGDLGGYLEAVEQHYAPLRRIISGSTSGPDSTSGSELHGGAAVLEKGASVDS